MSPKLSVIIPCYNVERFIVTCTENLFHLPIQPNNWEMICYNDCSTDNTLVILQELVNRYPNIRVISGNKNIGPGGGRNVALKSAKGEYVWFVDADDIVLPDLIPAITKLWTEEKVDVIPFNYKEIDINDQVTAEPIVFNNTKIMKGIDFVDSVFGTGIVHHMGYPWRFIVRREFLLQNRIFFPENIRYGEDTIWMPQILLWAKRVASVSTFGYMYRHHNQSTCGMFDQSYPGRIIYERCIVTGDLLISFAQEIVSSIKDKGIGKYATAFIETAKHRYIGQLPIYLGRTSLKERNQFFHHLKTKGCSKQTSRYAPLVSRLILTPIIGRGVAELLSILYKIRH